MKGIIIYKGKYGATREYANWLARETGFPSTTPENLAKNTLENADIVILGTSVYIGKLQLAKWLQRNSKLLQGKQIFLFVVCGTPANETEKLNSYLRNGIPSSLIFHCNPHFLPGRLLYNNLKWTDKFLLKMGAKLAGKDQGQQMLAGYDHVKKENLLPLLESIKHISELPLAG